MPKTTSGGGDLNDVGHVPEWGSARAAPPRGFVERGFDTPPRNTLASIAEAQYQGPPCPSLCEVGPCVNYHVLDYVMETAQPTDGSAGGLHIATARTCYPAKGVEFDELPRAVTRCNRWHPSTVPDEIQGIWSKRVEALEERYTTVLDAWLLERRREQEDAENVAVDATSQFIDSSNDDDNHDQPPTEGDAP